MNETTTIETNTEKLLDKTISFLREIGMIVHFQPINGKTFLPGISILNGEIIIDKEKLKYPGDILHEAGHIAVVPAAERHSLNEHTIGEREQNQAEEMMSIAWSYAVCVHLNVDAGFVFHDHGYKGGGSNIADDFREGRYFGVPMLQWVGMTREKKTTDDDIVYPGMRRWMRE